MTTKRDGDNNSLQKTYTENKLKFIANFKKSKNTANATIDDNANVSTHDMAVLNAEIHKEENQLLNIEIIKRKLHDMFPDNNIDEQFIEDLNTNLYLHDSSSQILFPYCVSISTYPFLLNGLKDLGGLSAKPKNIDSFCGMYINLIFAIASQFKGAVAVPSTFVMFDYFARKEWGNDYYLHYDLPTRVKYQESYDNCTISIKEQIHQYFQQIVYSINQPIGSRGMQSCFVNFSYFDKYYFEGMYGHFKFPDLTSPTWESVNWLQREFMKWFNNERLKCMLTYPVESVALLYENGEFKDKDMFNFVCEEYAEGHSFFTYISDSVDSLSSCCRLRNAITTNSFNFTNGNIGEMTGSKNVITIDLNRIVQDWYQTEFPNHTKGTKSYTKLTTLYTKSMLDYIEKILSRVYVYHEAFNNILHEMNNAGLMSVYKAGYIDLNKQYLTIGINGLNQAAEFLGITCSPNEDYSYLCRTLFEFIRDQNARHKKEGKIGEMYNTELVPAESAAIKLYNRDKKDGYWVPEDTNLYASYVFKPNDPTVNIFDKIALHGANFISQSCDGGSACHINLEEHLSNRQYQQILNYAGKKKCNYLTFNVPNSECESCGYITKYPIKKCPKCGSTNIALWDRVIGYLTKIKNWSDGRQTEQKTRIYHDKKQ